VYDVVDKTPDTEPKANCPKVSVVIPAYNAQRYLFEAVNSVLGQTYRDFECIVVDDGSTDRTGAILWELAARDARVKPLKIAHGGIVTALNTGIHAARGEFIARMDADDICVPERFAKQVRYLDEHPECVAVGSNVILVDPFNSEVHQATVKIDHEQIEADLLAGNSWAMIHPTTLIRKQALLDIGGYRAEYEWSEDLDVFLRLAEKGKLANMPEPLLRYRQHFSSINRTKIDLQRRRSERLLAEAHHRRGLAVPAEFKIELGDQLSRYEQVLAWGRCALATHNLAAARRHALVAIRYEPLKHDSWSLAFHAWSGR
jgi:glycosyltransferase involved in cell wall biosynthesis